MSYMKIAYAQGQADALAALGIKQADLRQTVMQTGERMLGGMRNMFTPARGMQAFTQGAEQAIAKSVPGSVATQGFREAGHVPFAAHSVPQFPVHTQASKGFDNFVDNTRLTFQGDLGGQMRVPLSQGRPLVPKDIREMGIRKAIIHEAPAGGGGFDPRSLLEGFDV